MQALELNLATRPFRRMSNTSVRRGAQLIAGLIVEISQLPLTRRCTPSTYQEYLLAKAPPLDPSAAPV